MYFCRQNPCLCKTWGIRHEDVPNGSPSRESLTRSNGGSGDFYEWRWVFEAGMIFKTGKQ